MPSGGRYTFEDYWNLPDGVHAELVDGDLLYMATSGLLHQEIVLGILRALMNHADRLEGPRPEINMRVAVNLNGDESTWVEPDIVVVCDPVKLSERAVEGAPDLVIEVVSPQSVQTDYFIKPRLYHDAGVREYWIADPTSERTTIYQFRAGDANTSPLISVCPFSQPAPVSLLEGLSITVAELL